MIYKEQGIVKIHQLQVIHIDEVDHNFLVGIVQQEAIQHAQLLEDINQQQYGGCSGRDCMSVTYLEELRRDILLLTCTFYANFDIDATLYYDKIQMSVASLSGRKYGVHKKIVYLHAVTLEEAEYKHCDKFPIHGIGH